MAEGKEKPCCNEKKGEKKLVKATELPIHGNPYPPKDVLQNETPGMLEAKVAAMRTTLQPYVTPVASVFERTGEIVSVGVAHSQSTMQRLAENQNTLLNAVIISGSGFVGMLLARRGVFRRLLFGSAFFAGATAALYPKEAEEKGKLLWYVAKNKLPSVAEQQYGKLFGAGNKKEDTIEQATNTEPKTVDK